MKYGTITQVSGPVVDVDFEIGTSAQDPGGADRRGQRNTAGVMEVAQHVGRRHRPLHHAGGQRGSCPAGMKVMRPRHRPSRVPVGEQTLGRMFNVAGQGHRRQGGACRRRRSADSIYRKAPAFADQQPDRARFWRPASRSSTCWSRIRRAARSACSAARASAKPS